MSQLRAFLAIDVDEDIKAKMYKIIKEFKQIDANIKYVDLENIHLTLKFFGEIDSEGIELLSSKIESVVSNFDKFTIKIKGCGAFPNTNRIKVIWLGIDGDEVIKQLHDELDKEFVKIGFDKDKKFSSHLTIGRMRNAKGKNKVKSTIEEFSEVEVGQMDVDRIILKKSTLTPAGPIYEDLKTFEL
ncbi:RNA 2',3'-cyclic phosphodiesterase [Methanobrevibacter sp.]|uniref:RNA 2',3'-cyclic phosphodiesterase n=1 Tax=Methanobrevibacter sp. TaxID=66852 RepID=UPI0026E01515|nr:RNA 2',3'-cyclic phosphodiesterase [Methanobrevibacter sp.]MDO5860606.1 RNA 2',3'-cyclic phosphodiesterase [Methanobrevibacter sp.]